MINKATKHFLCIMIITGKQAIKAPTISGNTKKKK
jgi:hypothetical protein